MPIPACWEILDNDNAALQSPDTRLCLHGNSLHTAAFVHLPCHHTGLCRQSKPVSFLGGAPDRTPRVARPHGDVGPMQNPLFLEKHCSADVEPGAPPSAQATAHWCSRLSHWSTEHACRIVGREWLPSHPKAERQGPARGTGGLVVCC